MAKNYRTCYTTVKIWSIQSIDAYRHLLRYGSLRGDYRRVHLADRPAYRWMSEQLRQRSVANCTGSFVWAWHTYSAEYKRPDLRRRHHLPLGTKGVRIELEVDRQEVLLSLVDPWICVLRGTYVPISTAEAAMYDLLQGRRRGRREIRKTWPRIFDLSLRHRALWGRSKQYSIQACMPMIDISQVRDVRFFTAK